MRFLSAAWKFVLWCSPGLVMLGLFNLGRLQGAQTGSLADWLFYSAVPLATGGGLALLNLWGRLRTAKLPGTLASQLQGRARQVIGDEIGRLHSAGEHDAALALGQTMRTLPWRNVDTLGTPVAKGAGK